MLEFDRVSGFSGYVRGGWVVSDRVRVGAEFNLWRRAPEEAIPESAYRLSGVTAIIAYYPDGRGLFVRAGAGLGFVAGDVDLYKGIMLDRSKGVGAIAGVGYDIPIGRRVSLTPAAGLWYASIGDLKSGPDVFRSGWSQHVFDVTLGLTLR